MTLQPNREVPGKWLLHIDGSGFSWTPAVGNQPRRASLVLSVTTFDVKGNIVDEDAKRLNVAAHGADVPPTGPLDRGVNLDYQVDPNPRAVRARFVVRVDASGRMGTADADLLQSRQAPSTAPEATGRGAANAARVPPSTP